jgi:hypothetical protein
MSHMSVRAYRKHINPMRSPLSVALYAKPTVSFRRPEFKVKLFVLWFLSHHPNTCWTETDI